MKILITGGAGFIGSNLVEKLINQKKVKKNEIIVYDNLYLGKKRFLKKFLKYKNFKFIKGDLLNQKQINKAMKGVDMVFHLAANSDILKGTKHTSLDLRLNTLATYNVLEAMRLNKVKDIIFSSTSTIYGEVNEAIPEDYGPCQPISLYGASKLSAELFISAFCHNFDMKAIIFRFANVIGNNSTHGIIYDFIKKLEKNPKELEILGDGKQSKPYIEVKNLLEGVFHCVYTLQSAPKGIYTFNIGPKDSISASEIGDIVIKGMGLKAKKRFTGGKRGWRGDIPKFLLDTSRINALGWKPKYTSKEAVKKAVETLCKQ